MIEIFALGTALILALGAGVIIGIYVTTQIGSWIDKNTKK